jgi:hypothetical protein
MVVLCSTEIMVEIGTDMWIVGGLLSNATDGNGDPATYPTTEYKIDGISGESPPVMLLVRH